MVQNKQNSKQNIFALSLTIKIGFRKKKTLAVKILLYFPLCTQGACVSQNLKQVASQVAFLAGFGILSSLTTWVPRGKHFLLKLTLTFRCVFTCPVCCLCLSTQSPKSR
jgi:hypothetical protein